MLVAGCSDDEPRGVVPDARPAQVSGTELWAQLPTGRVTLTVGAPVRTIPGDEVVGGAAIDADDDAEFLPVAVDYGRLEGVPWSAPLGSTDPEELTKLAVEVGGRSYPVPFDDVGGRSYVEVPAGADDDLALEVTFDGVTQRIDAAGKRELGKAAGLYDATERTGVVSCGEWDVDRPGGAPRATARRCGYDLWEYPWVAGRGWAAEREAGATWVVATADMWLRADEIRSGSTACESDDLDGRLLLRVDGRDRTDDVRAETGHPPGAGRLVAQEVFLLPPAPQHDLEITSTWTCRIGDHDVEREFVDRVNAPS
ncbi:hypothetical protein FHP29_10135 [Nocardioides albidus]|uniref:Uncharacterized protein n=1 Tax=Nocardioides albidus TaxID=1517589 RepID=A0A5C4VWY1_9ACTN|nr:hypothetical protein [Nocardioides albidus]TNM40407.1 hypothetical protein FHP29_10135 [Nocardioides albidus]